MDGALGLQRDVELTEGRQLMEDCFDQLVEEYDTLEIGDLEDAEEGLAQTEGRFDLGNFESVLDDFISEKRGKEYVAYEVAAEGGAPKGPKEEAPADTGAAQEGTQERKVVRFDLDDESKVLSGHKDAELKEKTRELAMRRAAEEERGESDAGLVGERDRLTVTVRKADNWDCESVLSLVSNLDNHPALLSSKAGKARAERGRKQAAAAVIEEDDEEEEDEEVVVVVAGPRKKGETAEEKKARKQAVKQAKREARSRKKEKKIEFKHIKINQQQQQQSSGSHVSVRPY